MMSFWLGTYERGKMLAFAARLTSGAVVYDVGANVGAYTVLAARHCAEVHSFEPDQANLAHLRRNVALNNFTNCAVIDAAVGSRDGHASFATGLEHTEGRLDAGGSIAVRCVTLDSYARDHRPPDLVKMDIEGGETEALAGAKQMFTSARPQLFLAMHGASAQEFCVRFLTEHHYRADFLADDEILATPIGRAGEP
jgi:FkbM family methyltransferase